MHARRGAITASATDGLQFYARVWQCGTASGNAAACNHMTLAVDPLVVVYMYYCIDHDVAAAAYLLAGAALRAAAAAQSYWEVAERQYQRKFERDDTS